MNVRTGVKTTWGGLAALCLAAAWVDGFAAGPDASQQQLPLPSTAETPHVTPGVLSTGMRSSDLPRSIRFYTDGLGMVVLRTLVMGPLTEVILGFPGQTDRPGLLLLQRKGPDASLPVDHGNADTKIVMSVPDVEALGAKLTAAGYSVGDKHQNGPYKIMVAHDPDGYKLELVQMPRS